MGAEFLELDFEEEAGSGDGYAKVMSEAGDQLSDQSCKTPQHRHRNP
jgi:NAD/NADP transhydrogenase alpha subunit